MFICGMVFQCAGILKSGLSLNQLQQIFSALGADALPATPPRRLQLYEDQQLSQYILFQLIKITKCSYILVNGRLIRVILIIKYYVKQNIDLRNVYYIYLNCY